MIYGVGELEMKKTVVVLGNNFGGLTAALSLKKDLKDDDELHPAN